MGIQGSQTKELTLKEVQLRALLAMERAGFIEFDPNLTEATLKRDPLPRVAASPVRLTQMLERLRFAVPIDSPDLEALAQAGGVAWDLYVGMNLLQHLNTQPAPEEDIEWVLYFLGAHYRPTPQPDGENRLWFTPNPEMERFLRRTVAEKKTYRMN